VIAISAQGDSPLAEAAGAWLPLGPFEDTEVATLSYTATLQAMGMFCDALLGTTSGWAELPAAAASLLDRCAPLVAETAEGFAEVSAVDAVGRGGARASAGEAALLVREGLRLPAVGMETREYLHGPLEAVTDGFGCVVVGGARESELAAELASFGARTMLITEDGTDEDAERYEIQIPAASSLAAPVLQILPVQLLVDDLARLRGLEIGKLRRQQPDTKVA
jgi:glucosamine--fructose-6-phosphate aminotransferase (isomerizing)